MKKKVTSPDELDLFQLAQATQELDQRRKELEERQRKAVEERLDNENTMPPSEIIRLTRKQKEHDEAVSRNKVRNVQREQRKSLFFLAVLIATTATLIWWGLKLMQGS